MKITLIIVFQFIFLFSFAQKAIIKGTVKDVKTGELLFGTNVFVTAASIGAMTDFDGNFQIEVESGTYELNCSFVSYEAQKVTIIISAGETKIQNFDLGGSSFELEDVQVVAKRVDRTESAIVAMQKKSATVVSGISAQEMTKSGASDAAGALKKVTGVSVQGGKYVYVRGLSDRYSKTLLNGAEIPSLDPERNTVQMDLFPSNILENIMVHKAFSPDLPADFTGGLIDIKTKDFPERFKLGFSAELGYNPQSNLIDDFLSHEGSSTDFLGLDNGARAIPNEANGDIPYRLQGKDEQLNQITKSFNKNWDVTRKATGLNQKYAVDFGNTNLLFGKELGYSVAATYSHKDKYDDAMRYGRYELVDPNDKTLNSISGSQNYETGEEEVMWSTMAVLGLKLNNKNQIGLSIINNHKGEKQSSYMLYNDFKNSDGENREKRILEFASRNLLVSQLKGKHELEKFELDWIASYAKAKQDEPDTRFLINQFEVEDQDTSYFIDPSTISAPRRFYRTMDEDVFFAKLDLVYPFKFMGAESKFKVGASENYKKRTYRQKQINFYEANFTEYDYITDYFDASNIDTKEGVRAQGSTREDDKNSYDGQQSIIGSYAMVDLPFKKKFRLVAGLRFEKVYMYTESLKEQVGTQANYGELDEVSFLPSFNFTYKQNDKTNWRLAYSKTLARPSFREKSPLAIESKTGDVVIGNVDLKQTNIDNLDFRWEKYFKPGEVFSLGLFYKHFENPIEKTFNTKAQNPELTWRNVDEANLYGAEIEFSKKLDFISSLKRFKVSTNFTYVYSAVDVDEQELEIKKIYDPEVKNTRTMSEQSPFIFNAMLSYATDSSGWNANISYTYNAKKLVLVNPTGIPDIYQNPTNELNFNVSKQISKHFTIKFQVKNILDNRTTKVYDYMDEAYIYSDYGWGRAYSLKLSYRF